MGFVGYIGDSVVLWDCIRADRGFMGYIGDGRAFCSYIGDRTRF